MSIGKADLGGLEEAVYVNIADGRRAPLQSAGNRDL
jgi:hypothetical protein